MTPHEPIAPTAASRVQGMKLGRIETIADLEALAPGTSLEAMEVRIESVDDESIVVSMPVTDRVRQPMGLLHGGMTMFLMESAGSIHACWKVDLSKRAPVGIEINGSHVQAAGSGTVRATARVVRRSRTFIVHTIEVHHVESGRLLSTGRMTNFYLRHGAEPASG
jgi:1,4-dihydroxy-2-naphthoyl-CoA hydrolase